MTIHNLIQRVLNFFRATREELDAEDNLAKAEKRAVDLEIDFLNEQYERKWERFKRRK